MCTLTCCYISLHAPMHSTCHMHPYAPYTSSANVPLYTSMCFYVSYVLLCALTCLICTSYTPLHAPMCPYMPLRSPYVLLCTPIQPITSLFAPYMSLHVPYISHLHLQWSCAPLCASLCPYMPYIHYMLLCTPKCVPVYPLCMPCVSYTPVHALYVHLTRILIGLWSPHYN